jgi:N-acetylglucosamine kinase-like BadF-type ATPase
VLADSIARVSGGESVAAVCVGMAGVDRPEDLAVMTAVLARVARGSAAVIVNDALIALEAGVRGGPGTVLIAGTGSIAYGRDANGRAARAGGWGYVLGDEGSGYWLGRQALRAVVRAADGRGPRTALTPRVLAHYGVASPQDLVRLMSGGGAKPAAIATLAREVEAAADDRDAVAQRLVSDAARQLASAAESVVRRLDLHCAPLLLSGGILAGFERLRSAVISEMTRRLPTIAPTLLTAEPASGAVQLALERQAGTLVLPTYRD